MKFRKETEFQETEIGRIARDWKVVRLKDVAEIRGSRKITQSSDTLTFIPMEAIPDDGVYAGFELRDANEVKSYVYCEPGDILLAKITPSFENGKQGIVPEEIPGKFALATTEVYPIRCKNINKFFLFHLLKYPPLRNKLASLMRGTTGRKRVPREALEDQLIPYPPLKEQENIGKVLLTIQNLKESMRDAIVRLERLKRGLMGELLTGRIRIREENGRISFYRETELQETEIGKIPRNWRIEKLGSIVVKAKMGGTPKRSVREYWDGDIPFAKIEDITSSHKYLFKTSTTMTRLGLENSNAWIVPRDSLLITIYGTLGAVAINKIELATNQAIVGIVPKKEIVDVEFLYYWYSFFQPNWNRYVKKSTQPNLTLEIIVNSIIPLPPLNEQKGIVRILSLIDRTIELYHRERERLERLKRGLMDLLLTGKVRVVDGDVGS